MSGIPRSSQIAAGADMEATESVLESFLVEGEYRLASSYFSLVVCLSLKLKVNVDFHTS